MEAELSVCKNCKRSVTSAHLALHEAHCLRHLVLCPECKEVIPKENMGEHLEKGHEQVCCAMCQLCMQKHLLEVHEAKECCKRPVKCKFCELAMHFNKLGVHEDYCGNRTELCTNCNQYVTRQELTHHKGVCQGQQAQLREGMKIAAPVRKIRCHSCNQMIPGNNYFHHVNECCRISEPEIPPPTLPSQPAEDRTSTKEKVVRPKTKNTKRSSLLSKNSTKREPRGKSQILALPLRSEGKSRTATFPVEEEAAYDILRRCPRCGILLPLPILCQHQVLVCPGTTAKSGNKQTKKTISSFSSSVSSASPKAQRP